MKKYFFLLIILNILISCYLADNSNNNSGSITFNLPDTIKASAPPALLQLKFFKEGEMLVSSDPSISYLSDYPDQITVTGDLEFSITTGDYEGSTTVTGVPSEIGLQILAEYFEESNAGTENWDLTQAGLSETFTVTEGSNTNISLSLNDIKYGTVTVNNDEGWSTCYFRAYEPDDLDSFIYTEEGTAYRNPTEPVTLCEAEGSVSGNLIFQDAILPGRKMKMLITNQSSSDSDPVGLSEEFELRPGETKTISASYYSSCIQIS